MNRANEKLIVALLIVNKLTVRRLAANAHDMAAIATLCFGIHKPSLEVGRRININEHEIMGPNRSCVKELHVST